MIIMIIIIILRSISDPGPLRIPDPKTVVKEESSKTTIGLPRHVIVHHSSARGATELDTQFSGGYSGGSVTYSDDTSVYQLPDLAQHSPEDFQRIQSPGEELTTRHSAVK